ncbi:enoyl-CoA hydratase/isomerase family protein [Congregibacter variabilis]|uniref:Enoyl-CoA hydratase/isomerase family protein n=1 Tax=Congregibacter variabilis TaxID=3081200 RepID=A0ABZ0HYN5_9GAMM|nr:enoyl-CoA hydratase/isomerase family protein [Congregibacter sp. IMCC43200]
MYKTLEIERQGGIARLWLNRPKKLNPLSLQTLEELTQAAAELNQDKSLKVVVVSGRGRCFSAGADLAGFPQPGDPEARDAADAGRRMADAIEQIRAITIARIQGWCVGGGLVLAAACDLRVAASDARFSIPEIDLGIPLAWGGIPRLVREIGPALTKELVMTCRPFDAQEALRAGFLNNTAEPDDLDAAVDALAQAIAQRPSFAVQATKRHVDAVTANQVGLSRSWSDADSLLSGLLDPECQEARKRYIQERAKK